MFLSVVTISLFFFFFFQMFVFHQFQNQGYRRPSQIFIRGRGRFFFFFFFFFSSRRRHTRCREVSWARRCVQETALMEARSDTDVQIDRRTWVQGRKKKKKKKKPPPASYKNLTWPTIPLVLKLMKHEHLKKKKKKQRYSNDRQKHTE
eukprot:TRINITY_DN8031_c0_g1_i1.p2 TRINITY_DN8031_c0_g1~~TRINITY_DN8031_c0_g1_i1.p2  ORF type:complete len:148 (-),score=57.09 TRINITY_DN8031_c0_g1_i1:78-521(-)